MTDKGDFGFYGDEAEKDEVKDIRGITDEVSEFVYSDMSFPCICLKADIKLPRHKWLIISKLVKQGTVSKDISVYMVRNGELFKAGALTGAQIKSFIDIIGLENMYGYHNKDKKLVGDKLYVLSSIL